MTQALAERQDGAGELAASVSTAPVLEVRDLAVGLDREDGRVPIVQGVSF